MNPLYDPLYQDIVELQINIIKGNHINLSAVDNSGELYIYENQERLLYYGEYFSHAACTDVCALLGIEDIDEE